MLCTVYDARTSMEFGHKLGLNRSMFCIKACHKSKKYKTKQKKRRKETMFQGLSVHDRWQAVDFHVVPLLCLLFLAG